MHNLQKKTQENNQFNDILLNYQQKGKMEREITPNMNAEAIADIISDKLITKIQESLKSDTSQTDNSQKS